MITNKKKKSLYSMRYGSGIREINFMKLSKAILNNLKAICCGDGHIDIITLGLSGYLYQLSSND